MVSCTKELESVAVASDQLPQHHAALRDALRGRRIVFLDTPGFGDADGFSDTDIGDDEILIRIANWLETS
jgi:hypothetical protein